jgi:predicted tellurium resistance membrane protein TerC
MTDLDDAQGIRGRRKTTYVGAAIVLVVVGVMLAITSWVTKAGALLWVGLACFAVAALLVLIGKRVRHTPPSHQDHPHLTHDEDHPRDRT